MGPKRDRVPVTYSLSIRVLWSASQISSACSITCGHAVKVHWPGIRGTKQEVVLLSDLFTSVNFRIMVCLQGHQGRRS